ncbi:MAG: hypothetical protein ACSHXK_02985 [Oceanococcus sp.]
MLPTLLIALLCASLSGVWLWFSWRRQGPELPELRVGLHALIAAAALVVLVVALDNHGSDDGLRLLAVFFSIATGVLLFLKRQRQRQFPNTLLIAHVLCALAAIAVVAWAFV